MGVFAQNSGTGSAQAADPRLTPTPDYGTLGPDSDIAKSSGGSLVTPLLTRTNVSSDGRRSVPNNLRSLQLLAMLGGIVSALLASGGAAGWKKIASTFSAKKNPAVSSARFAGRDLDRQRPQKQAEMLLARAVGRSDGANEEIQAHVQSWRANMGCNQELTQLTTFALNSSDQNVRSSGVEVQLAAYGLSKSEPTVEGLVVQANSSDHAQKIWAL